MNTTLIIRFSGTSRQVAKAMAVLLKLACNITLVELAVREVKL